ncbi:MAG: magnesium/cobalt transporter CorA [Candidatus Omnitrophota bacterium]
MARFRNKTSKSAGLLPGELVHIGNKRSESVNISIIDYTENSLEERDAVLAKECAVFKDTSAVTWININGIHDLSVIETLGQGFNIHPLVLEDIPNTSQRPKIDETEEYIFIVLKMLYIENDSKEIKSEQVSLVLGKNYVLSFQEREGDVFYKVRERIRSNKGRLRKMGADYLAYTLIDAIVDNYFMIIENMGDRVEGIEEELMQNPEPKILQMIYNLKQEALFLRKSVWPLREVISSLARGESKLIKKSTEIYLRDVYDHTIQVIDGIETFRDMISGMIDIYLSSVSNKMNEVMKVLTIIATIFIPITFIAGVFGMNFNPESSPWNMPELSWRYGYLMAWGLMISSAGVMIVYFKRKKWL